LVREDRPRRRDCPELGWLVRPAFICTGGIGFGAQIGASVTKFVLVLNTPEAIQAFARETKLRLGGGLSVTADPVGRSAEAGLTPTAALYACSRSQGLFARVSLEDSVIGTSRPTITTAVVMSRLLKFWRVAHRPAAECPAPCTTALSRPLARCTQAPGFSARAKTV
jgi:lipid-binding SYLF domain-containing protein